MKTGKGFRGGTPRYIKRKPRSKEVAEQIKKGDIFSGVIKTKIKVINKDVVVVTGGLDID